MPSNSNFIIFRSGQADQFGLDITAVVYCDFRLNRIALTGGKEINLTPDEFDIVIRAKKGQF